MNGEDWYDVRHGRLIITPDGTVKEEECEHANVCGKRRFRKDNMKTR